MKLVISSLFFHAHLIQIANPCVKNKDCRKEKQSEREGKGAQARENTIQHAINIIYALISLLQDKTF